VGKFEGFTDNKDLVGRAVGVWEFDIVGVVDLVEILGASLKSKIREGKFERTTGNEDADRNDDGFATGSQKFDGTEDKEESEVKDGKIVTSLTG